MDLEVDHLHIGDNLDILKRYGRAETVDLVYLDPPFKSNRAYHLIFRDESGRTSDAQQLAFDDSWHWGPTAEAHYRALVVPPEASPTPGRLSITIASLIEAIGRTELTAYLVEMAVRIVELHRVLKPTGSLWLHCDPTASHYLKVLLDAIFGPRHFRNEVVWLRSTSKSLQTRRLPNSHDTLLSYTKSEDARLRIDAAWMPHDPVYVKQKYPHVEGSSGRRYGLWDLTNPNRNRPNLTYEFLGITKVWRWTRERMETAYNAGLVVQPRPGAIPRFKRYLDEQRGRALGDVWADIDPINSQARERLGYPTQKPLPLLDRIIRLASDPGDVVLDPFCGCGTAIEAAIAAERRWIGIDVSDQALRVINERFQERYGHDVPTGIIAPKDVETARALSLRRPRGRTDFEEWAIGLIGGAPNPNKDRGVDGLIPFIGRRGKVRRAVVSVKSGKVNPGDVRDLKGAMTRERTVGILLTLRPASEEMKLEETVAGEFEPGIPRLQIITIEQAIAGTRPILPKYRPQELFAGVPEVEAGETVADRIADLEDQIADARRERRRREAERLERIRESVRRVLEGEEGKDSRAGTPERKIARRRPRRASPT